MAVSYTHLAIIEGVMMRGPYKTAMAVRKSNGEIILESNENGTKHRNAFLKLPLVRGCVNFVDSLVDVYKRQVLYRLR